MEGRIPVILEQFMSSPLVTWVKTFGQLGDKKGNMVSEYAELVDGIFLNKVMKQINPKVTAQGLNKVKGVGQKAQNLSVLIYHIKSYYQDTLHQLIMMPPPNVLLLGRNPVCEEGLEEMRKLLLLLLGCAVQCEKKEEYIENIQRLDFDTKAAIAAHIQEVTHCQDSVFDLHWLETEGLCPDEWENICRSMTINLKILVDQRDRQFETLVELLQGKETVQSAMFSDGPSLTESSSSQLPLSQQHLALELSDAKAKIKRLRQELEEKSEQLLDCRQDLDNMESELKRLQQENMQLLTDARAARMYRDELDAMRERAIRADKLESEVTRYRDKLHNMNFYKVKLEELKEDNQVLMESKAMLEEQLQNIIARSDKLHQLEKHNLLLEAKVHDMEEERDVDRRRIEELLERNIALELSQKRSMEESQHLGWELEQLTKNPHQTFGTELKSLGQEVTETTCSRLLKLEKENQMMKALEELGGTRHPSDDFHSYTSEGCPAQGTLENDSNGKEQDNGSVQVIECFSEKEKEAMDAKPEYVVENGGIELEDCTTAIFSSAFAGHNFPMTTQTPKNEHLHASLENGNCKLQCLEVELHELEIENQILQHSFKSITNQHQGQLEIENQGLVENEHVKQDRNFMEKEIRRLRQQVNIQEASLESSTLKLAVLEKENRTLVKKASYLSEACAKNKELEKDNQELLEQTGVDQKMLTTLREELLDQRFKNEQKETDLEKLTYELERLRLKHETCIGDQGSVDQSPCKHLESELESSLMKSLKIKKERMAALEARLQESSNINQQLRHDLKNVKQSYEALLQRVEEENEGQRSPPLAPSAWQRESHEATWALLKLKDRLIEVERNNATLQAEKQALHTQLQSLQTQSNGLQAQIVALQQQTASLQENNTTLQTHNAQLQVEKSTVSSQNASLVAHNAQLQRECQSSEVEREGVAREREDLRTVNELLLRDHERLSVLHERQAAELEVLSHRYSTLENSHRTLEIEHRSLEDKYNTLLQQRAQLEGLERALREEQQKMQNEICTHRNATAECQRLRDEKDWLNQTYQKLLAENEGLQAEHNSTKSQLNSSKLEQTQLESELFKLKEHNQQLNITTIKLTNQCELLTQLKGNLEEENRHLLDQIQSLMLQNRTLLDQTMESKDLFHVEQRQYIDKLNELRRQKEKLEEKIMDQYKFYDPSPSRRRGNWITLKMRKLMKTRNRDQENVHFSTPPLRSESCEGLDKLSCHDNGSFIGSQGSEESASNSLNGDTPSPKKSSINALKMFHVKRSKPKEKEKVKSLFRRSLSMFDLLQSEGCLDGDSGQLKEQAGEKIMHHSMAMSKKHSTSSSLLHYSSISSHNTILNQGKNLQEDTIPPNGTEEQNHAGLNGKSSRAPSASSGEFSVSFENEAWSSDSSPHVDPLSSRHHTSSDSSSPAQPNHEEPKLGFCSSGSGVRRSSSGRSTRDHSIQKLDKASIGLYKTQSVQSTEADPKLALETQGKSSSVSGCLNCFASPMQSPKPGQALASLPRASYVISTSEGSTWRASVHSTMSGKSVASQSSKNGAEPQMTQPEPNEEGLKGSPVLEEEEHKPEDIFDSAFTIDSVFTNTIFSESS
ncbi:girdin-like [Myxocyprinus asiaticus]|uniref:girdin-like n=1 Tax=Myxocyprinus asiaticus TaxID=70543 RepID=UPI002223BD52|nr:girdin-like [Myxocyprinus asiaticus]